MFRTGRLIILISIKFDESQLLSWNKPSLTGESSWKISTNRLQIRIDQ